MAENVAPLALPLHRFVSVTGQPLAGAKLYSYQTGTAIPLALYADPDGLAALPNPAIADANGQITFYGLTDEVYKLDLTDANDVPQPGWPLETVRGISSIHGQFTPVLQGTVTQGVGTYGTVSGVFEQFGPLVYITLGLTCLTHTGTGQAVIRGLPIEARQSSPFTVMVYGTGAAFGGPVIGFLNSTHPIPQLELWTQNLTNRQIVAVDLQTFITTAPPGSGMTITAGGVYMRI